MEFPNGTTENVAPVASATQAKMTGLAEKEYDEKKKRRKKRFWEGVTVLLLMLSITGCSTTRKVMNAEARDSVRVESAEKDSVWHAERTNLYTSEKVEANTILTVTLSEKGDTLRTDKVTRLWEKRERIHDSVVVRDSIRYRWKYKDVNHYYKVTVTKEKEPSLLQRVEIAGFWILMLLLIIAIAIRLINNKLKNIL